MRMAGSMPPIGDNLVLPGQVVNPLKIGLTVQTCVYLVRLEAEGFAATQKVVIQR